MHPKKRKAFHEEEVAKNKSVNKIEEKLKQERRQKSKEYLKERRVLISCPFFFFQIKDQEKNWAGPFNVLKCKEYGKIGSLEVTVLTQKW